MRNRNTIEFLGIWEQLNNPNFNSIKFDGIRKQAGLNSFSLTPQAVDVVHRCNRYLGKDRSLRRHLRPPRHRL